MYYHQRIEEQAFQLVSNIFVSLRNNVLSKNLFPWQEVSLILDCLIKMKNDLASLQKMQEKDIVCSLKDIYNQSYKDIIDKRFEIEGLYSLPNFEIVVNHLYEQHVLKNTVLHVYKELEQLQKNWDDYNTDDLFAILDRINEIPPSQLIEELSKHNSLSRMYNPSVMRNNKKEFFTVEGMLYSEDLDFYEPNHPFYPGVKRHNDAVCIWPFYCGYARILGKDGKWGYISNEDNKIYWLCDEVLYADDFKCERARIQLSEIGKSFKFLGLCLEDCFQVKYINATEFYNGYATVSDEFCENYKIDVFGNIIKDDVERYKFCIEKAEKDRQKYQHMMQEIINNRRKDRVYDPETEIMNSLSGHGADPEAFGF